MYDARSGYGANDPPGASPAYVVRYCSDRRRLIGEWAESEDNDDGEVSKHVRNRKLELRCFNPVSTYRCCSRRTSQYRALWGN